MLIENKPIAWVSKQLVLIDIAMTLNTHARWISENNEHHELNSTQYT